MSMYAQTLTHNYALPCSAHERTGRLLILAFTQQLSDDFIGYGVDADRIGVVLVYPDCLHPLQRTRDVRSGAKSLFDKNAADDGQHGLFPPLEGSGLISRTGGVQEQQRSEERRVGKECVSNGSTRWWREHSK